MKKNLWGQGNKQKRKEKKGDMKQKKFAQSVVPSHCLHHLHGSIEEHHDLLHGFRDFCLVPDKISYLTSCFGR